MRNALCAALSQWAVDPDLVFLTGDLGFQALEPLREVLGPRFINAGIAEQNMVSVAAGLARAGFRPWVYSIAPFIYARPYEQVRNDVCLHDLPVRLIGNGGGYGYGVMGGTHHALEDYGALLCLPNIHVFVPICDADLPPIVDHLTDSAHPAYLRLGCSELPSRWGPPPYAPWRRLLQGDGLTVVVIGPLAGSLVTAFADLPDRCRPDLWVVSELPIVAQTLPSAFLSDLRRSDHLMVVEEHVAHGGAGQMLTYVLMEMGMAPTQFSPHCAPNCLSTHYGSQRFHRQKCGLDPETLLERVAAHARQQATVSGIAFDGLVVA